MYSIGKTAQVTSEMQRYGIIILGASECRWSGFGRLRIQTGEIILYSGREDDVHQSEVAIVTTRYASRCLESWSPVSDRIITARFLIRMCTSIHGPPQMVSTETRSTTWQSGPSLRFHSKYKRTTIVQV